MSSASVVKRKMAWKARRWLTSDRCELCGCRMSFPGRPHPRLPTATLDHIKPRSKGGEDKESNWALVCEPCNQRKGDKWKATA